MSKKDSAKCSNFFVITFLTIFINFCASAPVNISENAYTQFVADLNRNQCSLPSQVQLPFDTSKANNFEYLSSYLEICQKTESTKRNKEAVVLCKEIFDNIRNISCPPKTALPDTINVNLSENVCQDIGVLKNLVPEDDKSLLKRLTDRFLCEIMCDSEFEKACQVLLWSFKVQKQVANGVTSAQEPEQPNVPGDGGDTNVDSFKQDNTVDGNGLPESNAEPENEKKAEEVKDVNETVRDAKVTEPSNLEDNPGQKPGALLIPSINGKQEKPVPNDKEVGSENQAVYKDKDQNSTSASKSTSSTKTLSTVTQNKPDTQTSNTQVKPVEKTIEGESNDQNTNKLLQSDATKYEEVYAGGELPQGSNTNVATDEQTGGVNDDNALADGGVENKKDTPIAVGQLQDNSNVPVGGEDNILGNEIPDETPEKGGQSADLIIKNDLPHESANEKSPKDAAVDQTKPLSITSNNDDLAKKTNSSFTNSQTTKDTTQQQIVQEITHDKMSSARFETKVDGLVTKSVLRKVEEIQDPSKTDSIIHDLTTENGTKNPSTDEKKPKVAEEFDNTIPDTSGKPAISDEKLTEKSQKTKPTAVNPDGKSVIPSSLTETSTKTTAALEKMEGGGDDREPADVVADHYGDQENTDVDEYPGQDYDGFGEVSKNKAPNPDVPGPITAAKETITSSNDRSMVFPPRNRFGQESSDIQMISAFPEQEDGHFFFYFLSIVLILMAGYLIFHNKQKIIALIVEGRHERNRRSHRIGYKKLETK